MDGQLYSSQNRLEEVSPELDFSWSNAFKTFIQFCCNWVQSTAINLLPVVTTVLYSHRKLTCSCNGHYTYSSSSYFQLILLNCSSTNCSQLQTFANLQTFCNRNNRKPLRAHLTLCSPSIQLIYYGSPAFFLESFFFLVSNLCSVIIRHLVILYATHFLSSLDTHLRCLRHSLNLRPPHVTSLPFIVHASCVIITFVNMNGHVSLSARYAPSC